MEVIWTRRALLCLDSISDYIARDNPDAARHWIARLLARAESAAALPFSGRVVREVGREDVREVFLRRYRIVYRVADTSVRILFVFQSSRLFPTDELEDDE